MRTLDPSAQRGGAVGTRAPSIAAAERHPNPIADILVTGTTASVLSSAATAGVSRWHTGRAASAVNGPSQWVWGRQAAWRKRTDLPHTALGYLVHHACSLLWAGVYDSATARTLLRRPLVRAAAVAALATVVDYTLMPRRFTPGWETRLTRPAIALIYAAFALGLVGGSRLRTAWAPLRRVTRSRVRGH